MASKTRKKFVWAIASIAIITLASLLLSMNFDSDQSPEGAYQRITKAVSRNEAEEFFAYLEEPAQHACFTIVDYRKKSLQLAKAHYPKEALLKLKNSFDVTADVNNASELFARIAQSEGWLDQLRQDMSGVARVERVGPRATVITQRGTRYSFRQRPNGIWGMTAFTSALVHDAQVASRDHQLVIESARDYQRGAAQ